MLTDWWDLTKSLTGHHCSNCKLLPTHYEVKAKLATHRVNVSHKASPVWTLTFKTLGKSEEYYHTITLCKEPESHAPALNSILNLE